MNSETIKILVGILGSSVVTALITHYLSARKERQATKRSENERIRTLYEETLNILEKGKKAMCYGDELYRDQIISINTRLELYAPPNILEQFGKAGIALNVWAEVAEKGEPIRRDGLITYSSQMSQHQKDADRLAPALQEEFQRLKRLMRQHITELQSK